MKITINTIGERYREDTPKEGTKLYKLLTNYKGLYSNHVADKFFDAHEDPSLGYSIPIEVFNTLRKYDQISIGIMTADTELGQAMINWLDGGDYYTLMGKRYETINGELVCCLMLKVDPDSESAGFYK